MIIIGAGPVGLEAALAGVARGLDVTVLEARAVGAALLAWGPTRFFSPLRMNVGPHGKKQLGAALGDGDAILTGPEHVERVLRPLAARLEGRVKTGRRVVSVARARLTRRDLPGHPIRAERPFRVLVEDASGAEEALEAEWVLDASGIYETPAWAGPGGAPALGERALGPRFIRHLGRLDELHGPRVLVTGHGHSAATAILALDRRAREQPDVRVTWATRSRNARPCVEVPSDPLPERRESVSKADDLATSPPFWLRVERAAHLEVARAVPSGIEARLSGARSGVFDAVAAFTGYRPDLSFLDELALEISPVSGGPRGVHHALSNVTDCLSTPALRAEDLASGEPGFYIVGAKSHGRSPTFLLEPAFRDLEEILRGIAG